MSHTYFFNQMNTFLIYEMVSKIFTERSSDMIH